jgi:clan AA aspartic protease (TIGR02281 family)
MSTLTHTFKTALLGACAAVTLGSPAHAATTQTILATSGTWAARQFLYDNGTSSCSLQTNFPDIGRHVLVAALPGKDALRVMVIYDDWSTPNDFTTRLDLVFDGTNQWDGGDHNALASKGTVVTEIAPASAPSFVHAFTAGATMQITVKGAPPLPVGLAGTTAIWGAFMDCVRTAAPAIVASINPSAAMAGSPPPAPVPPAQQPAVSEVGLLSRDGVKHVRGVAGSNTAIMFVLDSGAGDVQITRKAALDLALAGELVATGRTTAFVTATGATNVQPVYLLRSLTVGERTVTNVECNVTYDGDPLLGQSFLDRLSSWSIDNAKQTLVLGAAV